MSKKKADIKVIVTDIDGTLLNSQHKMTERTEKALKAAMAQGVKVVLATGKTRRSVDDIIKRLDLKTPGIYVQGLVISHPDGSEEHLGTLDAGLMRRVLTFIEDRGFQAMAYSGKRILVRSNTIEATVLTEEYDEPKPEAMGPLVNIVEDVPVNKLIFCGREAKHITALRWQLTHLIDGEARITQALPEAIELLPFGASKGTALKLLLKEMGLEPEEMLAIGDGENDIEMIQLAGIGVAVGNASPKLKAVADATVATNDDSGVAEAVEKFVLKAPVVTEKPVESVKAEVKSVETVKSEAKATDEKPTEPAKAETVAVATETKSE
jgi:Cof subfamily protein (haloacid dehalogenase superfamily)